MGKIEKEFMIHSFQQLASAYADSVKEVGLWQSEQYTFDKYFSLGDKILDIGCGAGRTTFGLYNKGYQNIVGLDFSLAMIQAAEAIAEEQDISISFVQGDALNIPYPNGTFDKALFSFNGLMQIPKQTNRIQALFEIKRVLKTNGIFIFTTHDQKDEYFTTFWEQEEMIWSEGKQDERLHEFGDIITTDFDSQKEIFIHIPTKEEVMNCLATTGFEVIETFYRSEKFNESTVVKNFSTDCRFWIVRKV